MANFIFQKGETMSAIGQVLMRVGFTDDEVVTISPMKDWQSLNWVYGARVDAENRELIEPQLKGAAEYRNDLCRAERDRRREVDAALAELAADYVSACEAVAEAEGTVESQYDSIKSRSATARQKVPPTKAEREAIADAKAKLKELRLSRKVVKQSAFSRPEVVARLKEIDQQHDKEAKRLYAESPIYWSTKVLTMQACSSFRSGAPPRFRAWGGAIKRRGSDLVRIDSGTMAVQLMKGLSVEDALAGEDTRLRLHVDGKNGVARLRIGSNPDRSPIFATVRFRMDRPFPDRAVIKWVYLDRRVTADTDRWALRFALDRPRETRLPRTPGGIVAVHVGWRKVEGNLRVAVWRGSDGRTGELVIPAEHVVLDQAPRGTRSVRDRNRDELLDRLVEDIDGLEVPEWLAKRRVHMKRWRGRYRLANLLVQWSENRFDGDSDVFDRLVSWMDRDNHLWRYEAGGKKKSRKRRDDAYRCFAKELSERYGRVCVMRADWARMREKELPDEELTQTSSMRDASSLAAVATLEAFLVESFGKDCVVEIDTKHLTADCAACGSREKINRSRVRHQCSGCGATWDQDANAAMNQLARAEAAAESLPSLAAVMSQRLTRNSQPKPLSQRQARFVAARERAREAKQGKELR